MNRKIGVIGAGFVGNAIINAYQLADYEVVVVDPKYNNTTIKQLIKQDPLITFIAVPSPSNPDGSCDTSILESVVEQLHYYQRPVISKVTAPPDVYKRISNKYSNILYVPEFLTAANANQDYLDTKVVMIGGRPDKDENIMDIAVTWLKSGYPNLEGWCMGDIESVSLVKYTINTFLATKVTFLNQIYSLCQEAGINYEHVKNAIMSDERMGSSHFNVPGIDNQFGFGGACFPKDTKALLHYAKSLNVKLDVLESAVEANELIVKNNIVNKVID